MDDKKHRIVLVLSPDRDPLINAADLDETLFDNALRGLDLQISPLSSSVAAFCKREALRVDPQPGAQQRRAMSQIECSFITVYTIHRYEAQDSQNERNLGQKTQNDASQKAQQRECGLGR